MACKQEKFPGKVVVMEYSIGCPDRLPAEHEWVRMGSMRTKVYTIDWDTSDATDDMSEGAIRENVATFMGINISGGGTVKSAGNGSLSIIELEKHVANPVATGGQPCAWFRITDPRLTRTCYMLINSMEPLSAPHDDITTYSFEAMGTASPFGLIIEDTPDANAPDVAAIEAIPSVLTLAIGASYDAEAVVYPPQANQNVRWESSNPAVASVNLITGVVSANALGAATITAKSVDNPSISDSCSVTVVSNPSAIEVSPGSVSVAEGATQQLTASVLPATALQNVTYITGDPAVATVSSTGLVTGVAEGETTITVRSAFAPGVIKAVQVEVTA